MATYSLLASNVLSVSATSVVFSSIPTGYTDLVIRATARHNGTGGNVWFIGAQYNSVTGNVYSDTFMVTDGSSAIGTGSTNETPFGAHALSMNYNTATANTFSNTEMYISSYSSQATKISNSDFANETNATTSIYTGFSGNRVVTTEAINQITLKPNGSVGGFAAGSSFYLYGVFNGPETLPSTPTIGTATATGATTATVAFTPTSATNVDASYTALSTPGSITVSGTSSPLAITGLTTGTAYTFQVRANNPGGSSAYSSASNSITPSTAFESIASATGTGSSGTITFNSIPSTYKHLQIRAIGRDAAGGNASGNVNLRFNGDTGTSYVAHFMEGTGSGTPQNTTNGTLTFIQVNRMTQGSAAGSNYYGVGVIDIMDYSLTTKNTTIRAHTGVEDNNTIYSTTDLVSGVWLNTSAVNSITIINGMGNNFNTNTVYSLYGIKG